MRFQKGWKTLKEQRSKLTKQERSSFL